MTITKPTEAVHCRLCKTEMKVDGLLYYCKETNCDTFPVCDLCLCHDCGRCDLCCTCIEQEVWAGGNLYCFTCGSVEYHALESEDGLATNADAICVKCKTTFGKDVSVADISIEKLYSDGVNFEFLVWWEKNVLNIPDTTDENDPADTEEEDEDYIFCARCGTNQQHKFLYRVVMGTTNNTSPKLECLVCGQTRFHRFRKMSDGSFTEVGTGQGVTPSLASTYHRSNVYNYGRYENSQWYGGGFHNCDHWRDPVKLGEYTVYASASSDKNSAKDTDIRPDYGFYFSTMSWSLKLTVTPDFPRELVKIDVAFPRLFYDWTDMSAPRRPYIVHIVKAATELIKEGKKVDIGCMGGHGRTGTFMALLAVELLEMTALDAINLVRKNHCQEAIETYAQRAFIYGFAGEPTPPAPVSLSASTNKNQGTKYKTRAEKKEGKKQRKARRIAFREKVKEAQGRGVTRLADFETNGFYWQCKSCCTMLQSMIERPHGRNDTTDDIYCTSCTKKTHHVRPEILWKEFES